MTAPQPETRVCLIHVRAMGWGLSAALLAVFVLCTLSSLIFPDARLARSWLDLFTAAPPGSAQSFLDGVLGSVAFGWVLGSVLAVVYNRLALRR